MSDDLVKQLRDICSATQNLDYTLKEELMDEAADRIEALEAERDALALAGDTLALRLTHIVGKEDIVQKWSTIRARSNERLKQ